MSAQAIEVEGLVRSFGAHRAVDGLSLSVARGEVLGLLGHNGAGKTTTVRVLNGVLGRDAGQVRVLGLDPALAGDEVRARTGVLTESPAVDERFDAWDNLLFFARLHGLRAPEGHRRAEALLTELELPLQRGLLVGAFSKGMKQKLAIARALLHEPEVLYLDEPTSGLDPVASRALIERVKGLARARGTTVLLCTHRLHEAQEACDRVAILAHGRLLKVGTPRELAQAATPASRPLELEVGEADEPRVRAALASLPGARVDRGEGAASFVVHGLLREDVPDLVQRLGAGGARVYRVTPREVTLEEVYLALDAEAPAARGETP